MEGQNRPAICRMARTNEGDGEHEKGDGLHHRSVTARSLRTSPRLGSITQRSDPRAPRRTAMLHEHPALQSLVPHRGEPAACGARITRHPLAYAAPSGNSSALPQAMRNPVLEPPLVLRRRRPLCLRGSPGRAKTPKPQHPAPAARLRP
jgi:hypothetical protein